MNLSPSQTTYISQAAKTAHQLGITSLIIEPGTVRGIDDARTVLLIHNEDVPNMPFGTICLNRISTFVERANMALSPSSVTEVMETGGSTPFAQTVTFKSGRTKIEFRCANPAVCKIPRQIVGEPAVVIESWPDLHKMLTSGKTAMACKDVCFYLNKGQLSVLMKDINSDELKIDSDVDISYCPGFHNHQFTHTYSLAAVLSVLKLNHTGKFAVNSRGFLTMPVNGLNAHILPLE